MGQQAITTNQCEDIEDHVEEWIDEQDCPGASVAIVDGAETVFAEGFGVRRLDSELPATADTLHGIGSVTKPVTATAVLRLVESGDVELDDAVSDYVPFFEDAPGGPITVHELLSHTSGMPADDIASMIILEEVLDIDVGRSIDGWDSFEEYVNATTDQRRVDGERFLYYNSGYVVLARVVEAVTGTPFAEFVEAAVFEPLEMDDATFDATVVGDEAEDAITPYFRDEDDELRPTPFPDNPVFDPPGGLLASVTDLAAFLSAQIAGGPHLDDALCERMHEPVATTESYVGGSEQRYGYGWFTRPFGDDALVGHSGGTGVTTAYAGFLRDRGLGVAVGCNANPTESPETLAVEILSMLTDRDPVSVLQRRALDEKAFPLTGRYESEEGLASATVTWTGSRLEIEVDHPMANETVRFWPTSLDPTEYEFVTVEKDGERNVAEFFVSDDGVELLVNWSLFRRVGDAESDES